MAPSIPTPTPEPQSTAAVAVLLKRLHDAELAAGHPSEAHLVDPLDTAFMALVIRPARAEVCGERFNEAVCRLAPHGPEVRHVSPDVDPDGLASPATAYEWGDEDERGVTVDWPVRGAA